MPIIPIVPEILIIPIISIINFAKGASRTGSRSTAGEKKLANREVLRDSEGNGEVRKRRGRIFDEKRV